MTPRFLGEWKTQEDVLDEFREHDWGGDSIRTVPLDDEENIEVLLACYERESYSGSAIVVGRWKKSGNLFCAEASHCSCNGLRGQWRPVFTTPEALRLFFRAWGQYRSCAAEVGVAMGELLSELGDPFANLEAGR